MTEAAVRTPVPRPITPLTSDDERRQSYGQLPGS